MTAVENDPYDNKGTLSVTTLIKPPYMRKLEVKHVDEITEDVADRVYSLLGQSVHHIAERAGHEDDLVEERFHAVIDGERVSGQADVLEADGTLTDFKVTSVWSIKEAKANGKREWEEQLNMLAYLASLDGYPVSRLRIVAIARDWRPSEDKRYEDYPARAESIEVPMWTQDEQLAFIKERVALHTMDNPPPCTAYDRWQTDSQWAVMKEGRKSAVRLCDSEADAKLWIAEHEPKGVISIVERKGQNVRCEGYCSVAPFCPKFAALCGTKMRKLSKDG